MIDFTSCKLSERYYDQGLSGRKLGGKYNICPVFDNGNSLNNFATDEQLAEYIKDEKNMDYEFRNFTSFWKDDDGKSLDIYKYISSKKDDDMNESLKRNIPRIKNRMSQIVDFINNCEDITEVRKKYYSKMIEGRFTRCILPLEK